MCSLWNVFSIECVLYRICSVQNVFCMECVGSSRHARARARAVTVSPNHAWVQERTKCSGPGLLWGGQKPKCKKKNWQWCCLTKFWLDARAPSTTAFSGVFRKEECISSLWRLPGKNCAPFHSGVAGARVPASTLTHWPVRTHYLLLECKQTVNAVCDCTLTHAGR